MADSKKHEILIQFFNLKTNQEFVNDQKVIYPPFKIYANEFLQTINYLKLTEIRKIQTRIYSQFIFSVDPEI